MTPPSLPGTENPGKPGSPDFILIVELISKVSLLIDRRLEGATFNCFGEQIQTMCVFMTACDLWHQMLQVTPRSVHSTVHLRISIL